MIKRLSEFQFTLYRPIDIEELGEMSPLKLKHTVNEDDEETEEGDGEEEGRESDTEILENLTFFICSLGNYL